MHATHAHAHAHPREIRAYRYLDRPYAKVRALLTHDPVAFLHRATEAAATHAEGVLATMKLEIAGIEVDRDVAVDVTIDPATKPPAALALPAMALTIAWRAAKKTSLFPSMRAELTVYPLSDDETQLDLHGWYTPPGGVLGTAADALVGHRIVEASVDRFLEDVCERLRSDAR